MRVKFQGSRLLHQGRFCLSIYSGTQHGQRGKRYFVVTDASLATAEPGSAPVVYITPWYHEALAFMSDEAKEGKR